MIACPSCGFEAPDDFTFCPKCATALAAPLAIPEERKVVTTLFCDLVAFTAMSEAADPEDIDALLGEYFARATKVIESHGGTVEKFIGDAVVGVFGVPAVHEDDPERAVRAGLRLIEALEGMTRPDGTPLQARCGVNTGEALVRLDVDPASGRGFLTGDAVNVAARLEAAASPMGVVVGPLTHALTDRSFAFEALPPLALKGKTDRVAAWLTVEALGGAVSRGAGLTSTSMVGRDAELASCEAAIARLGEGEGGLLLVTGEAGIGKTRLIEEVRANAEQRGMAWLQGHTLSFGRSISYWPFLEILQQDAGIESDDGEQARSTKLAARISALLEDQAPEVLPYLASMLSLPVPDELAERVSYLDSEAMGRQLYRASRLYLARLAEERPLVVVFEDVHWLDDSSAALLEHLLPLTAEVPLLICCVARPEVDSALTRLQELARGEHAERSSELRLEPLSSAESVTLASRLINSPDLPATLRKAILDKAEGNPFFVEEIVRSLIDLGGIVRDEATGGYRVTDQAGRIAIPDTLLGVITARVDRLDDDLKQVLRLAAVIGRSFFYRLLAAIAEADRALDESLAGLQDRDLVLEKAREPELEFIFKHALVQEATYESIVKRRRRELHREVAASMESLFADRLDDFFGLLAYHYTKAEDWEKAQEYLFKAGDQAEKLAADGEALLHYEQAMEAYSRAFQDSWSALERATVEHKMGEAFFRRGEHERARNYMHRALATLGAPFPATRGAVRRAIVWQTLRQLGHRLLPWSARRSATGDDRRIAEERYWIYSSLALMDIGEDQVRLLLIVLLALNVTESAGLDGLASTGMSTIGYVCDMIPLPRLARLYHRKALALARKAGDPWSIAKADFLAGAHQYWATGAWDSAFDLISGAREAFWRLGRVRNWGTAVAEAIDLDVDRGDLSQADALAREVVALAQDVGDRVVECWALTRIGWIEALRGDFGPAERDLRTGIHVLLETLQPADAVMAVGWLALCLLGQGRADEARAVLREQDERIRRYGIMGYFLRAFRVAEMLLALTDAEQAQGTRRQKALREARAACRALRRVGRADICGMVAAQRMDGTYAWVCGRRRRAEHCWRSSLVLAAKLGARYEGALTELEVGRRLGDREALERAVSAFEAMGSTPDLLQARELLAGSALHGSARVEH